jgi:uncharacterized membrane protein
MSSSELKTTAKRALRDNLFQKILLFILPLILSIISLKININNQNAIVFPNNPNTLLDVDWSAVLNQALPIILITIIFITITTIIITVFQAAGIFNYLEIFRGEKEEIHLSQDILRTFHDGSFWKIALLTVITQVSLLIIAFIPVIGLVVAIYLGLSWSQSIYVLYDKLKHDEYAGVWDVLQTSRSLMKGYKFRYFIFNLTFIGWYFLSVLFFGLPQIWVMPYTEMSMVTFYEARLQDRL